VFEFRTAVDDRLTDRRQDIFQTAYLSGFFQSPRESTGQDLATLLDISQPTITQHLRAGQHSLRVAV
jgi:predicted DNA binding protein